MGAYQTSGFAYQGAGQFAYQEASVGAALAKFFNPFIASVGNMMRR